MKIDRAVRIVERAGILLTYPIQNRSDPPSLWSEFYPNSAMSWAWDAGADPRVAEVWQLREALARSGEVAYGKWLGGRATFFSLPVFHALLARIRRAGDPLRGLSPEASRIIACLGERSPLSTKELRFAADLRGKALEGLFTAAMKSLWSRLLVVGTGEIDDGAFPSLAVAATELVFEDLVRAVGAPPPEGVALLASVEARSKAIAREIARSEAAVRTAAAPPTLARPRVVRGDQDDEEGPGVSMGPSPKSSRRRSRSRA